MSLARNSIPLTALSHSATGGTGARAFCSGVHSAPHHADPMPGAECGVRPPPLLVNADQTVGAPVSRADDVTIFGDHVRQPSPGGRFYTDRSPVGWVFSNYVSRRRPTLPVRQPDGAIKHIPLTTARKP